MKSLAGLDDKVQLLSALSDATRLRLLALLSRHELSVVELTTVTELGQSKVSTHLSRLREQNLLLDRKSGTSTYYRFNDQSAPETLSLWQTLSSSLSDVTLTRDAERVAEVLEAREKRTWPERMAGELERHYSPGRTWDSLARAFVELAQVGRVLDVGAGDGTVAELLAPRARDYVCLDASSTLVTAAQKRLSRLPCVRVVRADMHALPFASASFDQVLMLNVLAYADQPQLALDESIRVLARQGRLLLVTLAKHEHEDVAAQYGHKKHGFTTRWLKKALESRHMHVERCEITTREKQRPHFEIITCTAIKS